MRDIKSFALAVVEEWKGWLTGSLLMTAVAMIALRYPELAPLPLWEWFGLIFLFGLIAAFYRVYVAKEREIEKLASLLKPKIELSFHDQRSIIVDPHNYLKFHWLCHVKNGGGEALKKCHVKLRFDYIKTNFIVCVPFDLPPLDEQQVGFLFTTASENNDKPEDATITHYFYANGDLRIHPAPIVVPDGNHVIELTAYADNSTPVSIKLFMSRTGGRWKIRADTTAGPSAAPRSRAEPNPALTTVSAIRS